MDNKPVIRYRTEAFSGTGYRDAAEVMAFETFELGNTDILAHVKANFIKNTQLLEKCSAFIENLNENCCVDDLSEEDGIAFFQNVLSEIEKETGVSVRYVLWLADKETVTDGTWYGRDMFDESDYDAYEVGPIVLSDLGYDGTLYGYTEMPTPIEKELDIVINDAVVRSQECTDNGAHHFAKEDGYEMC